MASQWDRHWALLNALMCSTAKKVAHENKLTSFCKRYVDDKLALSDHYDATVFLASNTKQFPSGYKDSIHNGANQKQSTTFYWRGDHQNQSVSSNERFKEKHEGFSCTIRVTSGQ